VRHVPVVVRGLLLVTGAVWVILELRHSRTTRPEAVKRDRGSRVVLRLSTTAGWVVAVVLRTSLTATIHPASVFGWVGLGIVWCGVALRLWSIRTLGRFFTYTVQTSGDQPVITAGPYRLIRHPSYAGLLIAMTGLGIFVGNWWCVLIVFAGVLPGIVYRIRVEEQALLQSLGDMYREYAATRKRLIPFI
jgi:protein-S-isoprenylcysteine O-methyltransferase Ste14